MLATVACHRLDRVMVKVADKRVYRAYQMPEADMAAIRNAIVAALGLA